MSAPALRISPDSILNIVEGPNRGASYRLKGGTVRIGRSQENDIVLDDSKVSRGHVLIEVKAGEFWIKDSGSKKGFFANGQHSLEHKLHLGDRIQIGDTVFLFGPKPTALKLASPSTTAMASAAPRMNPAPTTQVPPRPPEKRQFIFLFFIFGAIFFVLAFFISGSSGTKKKAFPVNDERVIEEHVENIDKMNEAAQLEIIKKGKNTVQYNEAQSFYLQGFREFRESNFSRAIYNFETALTLYPEHLLAKRYVSRAKLKLNQEITAALERGERNFQAKRYKQAYGEYKAVLNLSGDIKSKNAQLALKRIEAINLIMMNSR